MNKTLIKSIAAGLVLAAASTASLAHEAHNGPKPKGAAALAPEQKAWGIAGKASAVKRTIDIAMADDMTFTPSVIEVREGDTIRLRLKNRGKELHELVLGTTAEIEAHAAMMKKFRTWNTTTRGWCTCPPARPATWSGPSTAPAISTSPAS